MGARIIIRKLIFVVLFNFIFLSAFSSVGNIKIQQGVLDLRGENYKNLTQISFAGEWEFYWDQLLEHSDFIADSALEFTCYEKIPSIWSDLEVEGQKLPAHGYCTYRIKVLTDTNGLSLALRVGSMASACKVYVDNKVLFEGGSLGKTKEETTPGYATGVKLFTNKSKDFDVIIQVANFHYSKGGAWNNINSIGKSEYVLKAWERNLEIRMFMVGSIIVIAIYFFGMYFLNRTFKSALFFAIFCVDIAVRSIVLDELYILRLIPNFSWDLLVRIEYLTMPFGAIVFLLFFYDLLSHGKKLLLRIIIGINALSVLTIIVFSVNGFTKLLSFYQLAMLISSVYSIYLVVRGLLKKDRIATVLFIALIIFVGTVVNDILYVNKTINSIFLTTYGFMFFIFMQAYMLSYRFLRMFHQTEELARNLEAINSNLEQTVVERTQEIQDQNDILLEQNDEITAQRDNIEMQNHELKKQKQVITDSINYAQRIQRAILPSQNILSGHLSDHFIIYKPKDIVSGDFYWFTKKENKLIIVAADCTGHGVPGAFMSMLGMAFLAEISKISKVDSASQMLEFLREKVKQSLRQYDVDSLQKEGMDLALCIYDPDIKILEYSGAYNPLYLIRDKELQIFKGDRQPASVHLKEKPFTDKKIEVLPNDTFYIFSDGFSDQVGGERRQKYMTKNFQKILVDIHEKPMNKQKSLLEEELQKWKGDYPQIDDILVIGFRLL